MKVHITEDTWFWTSKFVTVLFNNTVVMKSTQKQSTRELIKKMKYMYMMAIFKSQRRLFCLQKMDASRNSHMKKIKSASEN